MHKTIINKIKPHLGKTIDYLKGELSALQIGRANPSLIENLEVECYGQKFPVKQLGSIHAPEPRVIIIRPWDKSVIENIERAISQSRLGVSPVVEEESIRINIPPLSEERRKELVKIIQEKTEECRISVRRQREEVWKEIQDLEQEKKITEDDKYRAKEELQEIVDEHNNKIEEMTKKKEEEIMKV